MSVSVARLRGVKVASERKTLLDVSSGKKLRFTISLDEYEASRYLHLREWYLDATGQWCPGKRGITLNHERYRAVCQAFAGHHADICSWVDSSPAVAHKADPTAAANGADLHSLAALLRVEPGRRTGAFFAVEHRGALDTVTANQTHPFARSFESLDRPGQSAVANLLAAFARARETVAGADSGPAAALLDALEAEWGRQLRAYSDKGRAP
jgi:hypothetical protein